MDRLNHKPLSVTVEPATAEQAPILSQLLELYSHDFSELLELPIGEDGRFGYPYLPLYWREPTRFPFLVRADGALAGFVLIRQGSLVSGAPEVYDVSEFFVLRGYRRRGVGHEAAFATWRHFPGRWEVRVSQNNAAALAFWQRTINAFTGDLLTPTLVGSDGKYMHLFCFESPASTEPDPRHC